MNEKYLSIGMSIIILGMFVFWIGWHNADLGRNYLAVYEAHGLDYSLCYDCTLVGCIHCDNVYMNGMVFVIFGLLITLFGSFVMGIGFGSEEG